MKFILDQGIPQISVLAEQLETYLQGYGVPQATIMSINLCLDELLTNTLQYGYKAVGVDPEISVEMSVVDKLLKIEIIDNAVPFDPTAEAVTPDLESPLEQRRVGGLGIHLARTLSDSMHYQLDEARRNHLTLTKLL